ncbi:hypothetical protein APHAL10511_004725 [Amanita phalloides]|nr:hypothetical protein APHAL10511_004725 [Amanita phalloides]
MEFFSQTYVALRGPTGVTQTPADTIARLSDRLSPATLLADRRAAVLALKGLARDCKQDVGERALPGLLEVLSNDAEVDADIGRAVLETLNLLCDVEDTSPNSKELGLKHTNQVLANEKAINLLFVLLGDLTFYTRFASLQLLSTLLHNRRPVVQAYFLKTSTGPASVISVLEDKREIIQAISMVQLLISQNADIQKVLAFEGAFEKLFNIVAQEGGVDGGLVTEGALFCTDSLLRFNSSNQSYFRETTFPQALCSLLFFPWKMTDTDPTPQEFALQFWDEQKMTNTALVIDIMGILVGSKGGNAQESYTYTRCLTEMALASNAPTRLKAKALRLLPQNINFPLSEITVTPYLPVPETNGEEWDRLEPATALDVVVELALHGEYNGSNSAQQSEDILKLRTAAVTVFESFVRKEEIKLDILQAMVPAEDSPEASPPTPLVHALAIPPSTMAALEPAVVLTTHMASVLFSHLIRSSPQAKLLARTLKPGTLQALPGQAGSEFFVPADGGPPVLAASELIDEDEPPQTLLQTLSENLSLALLTRSRDGLSENEAKEWDRLIVAYLCLLSQWLWEDPGSVRDFLDAGGMGVLLEQINQVSEEDTVVPALCVFLLGICYEYNREPGEITRSTIAPILNRLGVDTLVGRMISIREDDRFKSVGPDSNAFGRHPSPSVHGKAEVWFDWSFVDFWKSNYYTIQRGFSTDPDQSTTMGQGTETSMVIASLRDVIQKQAQEIVDLQQQLKQSTRATRDEVVSLQEQVSTLSSQLAAAEERRKEVEKEQEDLLVLLDEMTAKRKEYKQRLKQAGMEVSEDEEEEEDALYKPLFVLPILLMSILDEATIVTPIPLPYAARSKAVLRSMVSRELQVDDSPQSPVIPLLGGPYQDLIGHTFSDSERNMRRNVLEPPYTAPLPNPIEPLLLALISPERARQQDNTAERASIGNQLSSAGQYDKTSLPRTMYTQAFWLVILFISPLTGALTGSSASCTDKRYRWAYSSQGHSPCNLAQELAEPCKPEGFILPPLKSGDLYLGPPVNQTDACQCSSVFYSLVSVCAACQGRGWLYWSNFSRNCSRSWVSSYLGDIPVNTTVPPYAYLNVTIGNKFDLTAAFRTATGSSSGFPNTPLHPHKASRIVGGVIACIAALVIAGGVLFWFYRRRSRFRLPKRSKRQYVSLPDPSTPAWTTFPQPVYQPERRNSLNASQYLPMYSPEHNHGASYAQGIENMDMLMLMGAHASQADCSLRFEGARQREALCESNQTLMIRWPTLAAQLCVRPFSSLPFSAFSGCVVMLHLPCLLLALFHTTFAQTNSATCTDSTFNWSFNTKGQNPCLIAEDLAGQCDPAGFNIPPLPLNDVYFGPTVAQANACHCSSVLYSLLSACGACQDRSWIKWSQYTPNCSEVYLTVYPKQIPADTGVPHWAYLDVSVANTFNAVAASSAVGPESTTPTVASTASSGSKSTSRPSSSSHSSSSNHAGAIAGGVIGGIVFLALVAATLLWFFKFRNSPQNVARTLAHTHGQEILSTSPPPASWSPGAPAVYNPQKLYDPQDPSTFPPAADQLAPIMGQSLTGTTYNSYPDAQRNQAGHYTGMPEV